MKPSVMIVGEAPGFNEDVKGIPFTGEAGAVLNQLLAAIGLKRSEVYVTNLVKCRPKGNRTPTPAEASDCGYRWLTKEIKLVSPQVIVTLGLPASTFLIGDQGTMERIGRVVHHIQLDGTDYQVFPTYHPAAELHNPAMSELVWHGFRRLKEYLDGTLEALVPSYDSAWKNKFLTVVTAPTVAVDTEIANTGKLHCISLAWREPDESSTVFFTAGGFKSAVPNYLGTHMVFHNALFDIPHLRAVGIKVTSFDDTMLMAHVLGEPGLSLKTLGRELLGARMDDFSKLFPNGVDDEDPEKVARYAALDAQVTLRLYERFRAELERRGLWDVYVTDREPLWLAMMMERNGILIDKEHFAKLEKLLETAIAAEQKAIDDCGYPMNPLSPAQVSDVVFRKLKLPRGRKTKTGYSTDRVALEAIEARHPIVPHIIEYRRLYKLLGTYVRPIPLAAGPDGRVRARIRPTGADTGRWSCGDPLNIYNQPTRDEEGRMVRDGFVAAPGYVWLSLDLNQIELRGLAHISRCPGLMRVFVHNQDVHRATGASVHGVPQDKVTAAMRRDAKFLNFGIPFGMSTSGLLVQVNQAIKRANKVSGGHEPLRDLDWAQTFMDRYFNSYPGVRRYMRQTEMFVRKHGYVQGWTGRRRWLFEVFHPYESVRAGAVRKAINMPVQELGVYVMKRLMGSLEVQHLLADAGDAIRPLATVYDSLDLEVREDIVNAVAAELLRIVPRINPLMVPITAEVKVGPRWGSLMPLEAC